MKSKNNNIRLVELDGSADIINITLLDGGRTSFYCRNGKSEFWIRIVTNGFADSPYEDGYWPGGLYLNDELIEYDSYEEKSLIEIIKNLKVSEEYLSHLHTDEQEEKIKSVTKLVNQIIDFIESDEYIRLAIMTGRIKAHNNT